MLDALKKKLVAVVSGEALEDKQEQEVLESVENVDVAASVEEVLAERLETSVGAVEELTSLLAQKDSLLAELGEQVQHFKQLAEDAHAKLEAVVADTKAKEVADRKTKLGDVIGSENPKFNEIFAAVESLNEEAFGSVLAGFQAAFEAEKQNVFFKEVGASGEAVAKAEESPEMRILKQSLNK